MRSSFFALGDSDVDRCAIFIDAGYLYAAAGSRYFGTRRRDRLQLDFGKFTEQIAGLAKDHCGLPHVRTYWYDAAVGGIPTPTHRALSFQQGVKLRLGRLTGIPLRQKGVDSRIVRDLIILSRNGVFTSGYLLSGDDDLTEGVIEAQEHGAYITLIGVAPNPGESNQSPRLVQNSDDFLLLDEAIIKACFSLRPESEGAYRIVTVDEAKELGVMFGLEWIELATPGDVAEVVSGNRPLLPSRVNTSLIRWAELEVGSLRDRDEIKRSLRAGLWDGLEEKGLVGKVDVEADSE